MPTSRPKRTERKRGEKACGAASRHPEPAPQNLPGMVDLEHWAQLIAAEEVSFPLDLPGKDSKRLESLVRERLRERMVKFIARRIARNLAEETG